MFDPEGLFGAPPPISSRCCRLFVSLSLFSFFLFLSPHSCQFSLIYIPSEHLDAPTYVRSRVGRQQMAVQLLARSFRFSAILPLSLARRHAEVKCRPWDPWNVAEIRGIGGMHAVPASSSWIIPLKGRERGGGLQSLHSRWTDTRA